MYMTGKGWHLPRVDVTTKDICTLEHALVGIWYPTEIRFGTMGKVMKTAMPYDLSYTR